MKNQWKNWHIEALLGETKRSRVYRISRKDMGIVYHSALKVISIQPAEYERMQELVRVLVLISGLKDSANILGCDDYEVVSKADDGWELYLRMELQLPLSVYTEQNILSEEEVLRLGIDICKALEVCEANNIVHRNIKPENIFISGAEDFLLGDFGSSELEKAAADLPQDCISPYMAPEVYKNLPYSNTADIYSLGAVLYRCINNNRPPFMPLFDEQPKIEPPCNADKKTAEVILKACAYSPEERCQSAAELKDALEKIYNKKYGFRFRISPWKTLLLTFIAVVASVSVILTLIHFSSNNKPFEAGTTDTQTTDASARELELQQQRETEYKVLTDRIKRMYRTDTLSNIISCSETGITALKADGTVLSYSVNSVYDVSEWTDISAVSQGTDHIVGLTHSGKVLAEGEDESGQCKVSGWSDITAVSAGAYFTAGLKSDGTCVAVGNNSDGQCFVSSLEELVGISAGHSHLVGINSRGSALSIGSNHFDEGDVFGWTDLSAVSAGQTHTVGLRSDGTVLATGSNVYGQCDVSEWKNITVVSAGGDFTVGIKSDGTVVSTENTLGLGSWENVVAISAGEDYAVGVQKDGTIICSGNEGFTEATENWILW